MRVCTRPPGVNCNARNPSTRRAASLAARLQAIGPKRKPVVLRPGFPFVAHAATMSRLPLRAVIDPKRQ